MDPGAQISAISMEFVKRHDLPIFQLQQLLDFERFGGVDIPYIGYTKLTLSILEIEGFRREILAFLQNDSKYSAEVPLIIGTLHINGILAYATAEELGKLSPAWYAGALGSQVLAKLAQLEERPIIDQRSLHETDEGCYNTCNAGTQNYWHCKNTCSHKKIECDDGGSAS